MCFVFISLCFQTLVLSLQICELYISVKLIIICTYIVLLGALPQIIDVLLILVDLFSLSLILDVFYYCIFKFTNILLANSNLLLILFSVFLKHNCHWNFPFWKLYFDLFKVYDILT